MTKKTLYKQHSSRTARSSFFTESVPCVRYRS